MPFVVLVLLWSYPLYCYVSGKAYTAPTQRVARLSLLGLELVCPSTTSMIMRTFVCVKFEDGRFLRANLTMLCDNSPKRRSFETFAWLMLIIYPFGLPLLMIAVLFPHRADIKSILGVLREQDQRRGTLSTVAELRAPTNPHRRPSVADASTRLMWLLPKVKKFRPSCWYMSVLMLTMRLTQTSLMVIFTEQKTQAMLASCIAMISACLHRELDPYRRQSDNKTALFANWLIYFWVVALLARLIRVLGHAPTVLVGLTLVIASLFVAGHALRSAQRDLKTERDNADGKEVEMTSMAIEPAATTCEGGEEESLSQDSDRHEKIVEDSSTVASSWQTLAVGPFCEAQGSDDDREAQSSPDGSAAPLPLCL